MRRARFLSTLMTMVVALTLFVGSGAEGFPNAQMVTRPPVPFTIPGLTAGAYTSAPFSSLLSRQEIRFMASAHVVVGTLADGEAAVIDTSMASRGVASAATVRGVHLAWVPRAGAGGYAVVRDGVLLSRLGARLSTYLDATAQPGQTYDYVVGRCTPATRESPCGDLGFRFPL